MVGGAVPVRLVVAVTDDAWFEHLRRRPDLTEVNFWAPSGASFKALQPGELFLFKLHAPRNYIVGGGLFTYANVLPCSLAWQAFSEANGASNLPEMRKRIAKYRRIDPADKSDFAIGCRILTQTFFLEESKWIEVPATWSPNIVALKGFSTEAADGLALWNAVQDRLSDAPSVGLAESQARFGEPVLIRPRLGQGAFRIIVTDSYNRRCAITGEKTLPALDAAHIRPYSEGGEHSATNGLLLRRDIHSLFDAGYVTVTKDYRFEVSGRIRQEFENGKHYYQLHGSLISLPKQRDRQPNAAALDWHNTNVFRS
jgi:putative restriction endonuclease